MPMLWQAEGNLTQLDHTLVLYNEESLFSLVLAFLTTLSPILLMAYYTAVVVTSRELTILLMWVGQSAGEGLNLVIKRIVKQDRPIVGHGPGYGFPSSHSQFMAYFSTFLICHLYFQHKPSSTGSVILDRLLRLCVYLGLFAWTGTVAFSRYYLRYHDVNQISWGLYIGSIYGAAFYMLAEFIPRRRPSSILGRLRTFLVTNPFSTWIQVRDSWSVWPDGGQQMQWDCWKSEWDKRQSVLSKRSS